MSATMARQGGRVQLEQSDMRFSLNMPKMAKEGFLRATVEETQFLIKTPQWKVKEEMKLGVGYSGHNTVKAAMERQPATLWENQIDSCYPCQNGTAGDPQTCWRHKGMGAPAPEWLRQPTPEPIARPSGTPSLPPGDNEGAHASGIDGVPAGYVYIHIPLPSAKFVNLDAYSKDRKCDKDFNPALLTDEGTSSY